MKRIMRFGGICAAAFIATGLLIQAASAQQPYAQLWGRYWSDFSTPPYEWVDYSATSYVYDWLNNPYCGFNGVASGGAMPYVSISAHGAKDDPTWNSKSGAHINGRVLYYYRVVPGSEAWANQNVNVNLSYTMQVSVSGSQWPIGWPYPGVVAETTVTSSLAPLAGGWMPVPDFSAWYRDLQTSEDGVYSESATANLSAPYNTWEYIQLDAYASAFVSDANRPGSARALTDPTLFLTGDWLAAHPGDSIEMRVVTAIPEPATGYLTVLAIAAVVWCRRTPKSTV